MFLIENPTIAQRRRRVGVMEYFEGKIRLGFNGRYLKYTEVTGLKEKKTSRIRPATDKPARRRGRYVPPPDHPWRRHTSFASS